MTNALDFFTTKNLFDFPKFDDFFNVSNYFTKSPKVNVKETDKAYEIEIANPGFSKDETSIEIKDHVIYVSMSSESEEGENDGDKYHVHQWSKSSYSESWNLPDNVIEEDISAENKDGILYITLPKKEEEIKRETKRTIEIK